MQHGNVDLDTDIISCQIAWRVLHHRYDEQSVKGGRHAEHLRISTRRHLRLDESKYRRRQDERKNVHEKCVWEERA